jgi:transketolase
MGTENLKRRILEIAYKNKLSHLGSYFSCIDIIDNIYRQMQQEDIFILSCGHAALALYVCNEKYFNINAEEMFLKHGGHPHRDEDNKIYCSTGSLGLGITIAIGRAVANPSRTVHVLLSDGECEEGSVWESLKIINDLKIENISVHVNINGYAAYKDINIKYLTERLKAFYTKIILHYTTVEQFSFLKGLNAHYHIMSEADFLQGKKELNEKGL